MYVGDVLPTAVAFELYYIYKNKTTTNTSSLYNFVHVHSYHSTIMFMRQACCCFFCLSLSLSI